MIYIADQQLVYLTYLCLVPPVIYMEHTSKALGGLVIFFCVKSSKLVTNYIHVLAYFRESEDFLRAATRSL